MALGGLLPAVMSLPPAPFTPTLTQTTTATQNAFLNDSWKPTAFVAPVVVGEATGKLRSGSFGNNSTQNTTYAIYDFLNNSSVTPAASTPIYSVVGTGNQITWRGESIYQFLDDSWTPSTPVEAYKAGNYKMHQMN
jgi:hypothetical protein